MGLVLASAAIVVALVAIGVTLEGLPGQGNGNQSAARTSTTSKSHATSTTTRPTTAPTTPSPPQKPAVLLSTSGGTATYQLRSASASIVFTASGPCWIEVRANSPLGQVVYEGILYAGQRWSVTGPAWIRLGNPPAMAVAVNGTPMTVPGTGVGVPLNLEFTLG